jgi:3-keto-disaccharide hydrolase
MTMRGAILFVGLFAWSGTSRGDDWRPLFNGKDLTGWRANNDPESFTVKDGLLRVRAAGKTSAHLFYVGDRKDGFEVFKDFELEAVARAEPDANGGVFVHTDMTTRDAQKHLAKGYEVQLNSSAREKRKTGSLYAVVDLDRSPVDESKWFTIRIVVRGKRITIALDGKQLVDYTEPPDVVRPKERAGRRFSPDGGAIALQAHDAGSVWYFKDIRVRRLP